MCIRHHIEFWLPVADGNITWERRVKRGLQRSGQNTNARVIYFYKCEDKFLKQAICPPHLTYQGGCYPDNRIAPFCYGDEDCLHRLNYFQNECEKAQREAESMEAYREGVILQEGANKKWRQAYEDWMSAYEAHRDCPDRRGGSRTIQALKRAGVLMDQPFYLDEIRLGPHPGQARQPIEGVHRFYDAPPPPRR